MSNMARRKSEVIQVILRKTTVPGTFLKDYCDELRKMPMRDLVKMATDLMKK
jgi:hypothetical protein